MEGVNGDLETLGIGLLLLRLRLDSVGIVADVGSIDGVAWVIGIELLLGLLGGPAEEGTDDVVKWLEEGRISELILEMLLMLLIVGCGEVGETEGVSEEGVGVGKSEVVGVGVRSGDSLVMEGSDDSPIDDSVEDSGRAISSGRISC